MTYTPERIEKLRKYRINARKAIKDLIRIASMWKEIALRHMSNADRWRTEHEKAFIQGFVFARTIEGQTFQSAEAAYKFYINTWSKQ